MYVQKIKPPKSKSTNNVFYVNVYRWPNTKRMSYGLPNQKRWIVDKMAEICGGRVYLLKVTVKDWGD